MVAIRKLKMPNIVSPYEDLVQLEVGNRMGIIAKFNLLSSKVQGPKNGLDDVVWLQLTTSWCIFYFIFEMYPDNVLFCKIWNAEIILYSILHFSLRSKTVCVNTHM